MPSDESMAGPDLVSLAGDVVAAYVAKNSVQKADLPGLIATVHAALAGLVTPVAAEPEKAVPKVSARKSITPEHLISLEDGRKYRTLKRHLTRLGLTPDQYRAKWGLPADYPMTAPEYSKRRSQIALERGLGRKAAVAPSSKAPAAKRQWSRHVFAGKARSG